MVKFFKRIGRIILFLACIILFINIIPANDAIAINPFARNDQSLLVVSQSGCGNEYPNNVMASFNAASSYGVMYFSINVVMTADEVLILADKDDIGVYTNQTGKISEKNYADIKKLNFAYNFMDEDGAYPYRSQNLKCVKVEDLFENFPHSNFIITIIQHNEQGQRVAVLLTELVRQYALSTRVVMIGDDTITDYTRSQTNVNILSAPKNNELATFDNFRKILLDPLYMNIDFQYVEIPLSDVIRSTKNMISALQNRNVSVFIKDVDTEQDYELALELDADGVITNDPALIAELIARDAELIPTE